MSKELDGILSHCLDKGFDVDGVIISPEYLVYEERVKMNCFYCGKYNQSWKCPPKIPCIDFKKMVTEYDNIALIYNKTIINEGGYDNARNESSVRLHRALLEAEKYLWENNNSTSLSFIGGSCKLCKNGCAPDRCANPYMARSPVEALGINVVKTAANAGVEVFFPPQDYMMRVGILMW